MSTIILSYDIFVVIINLFKGDYMLETLNFFKYIEKFKEEQIPLLIKSAIIILFFFILFKIIKFVILTATKKIKINTNKANTLKLFFINVTKYGIVFIAVIHVLDIYNVGSTSILTVAGIGSIALGFAAQNLVKDFIVGIFIFLEEQYNVSDIVEIQNITGTIEHVGLRTTKIRGFDGTLHIIPNSEIKIVSNKSNNYQSIYLEFPIPYEHDTNKIIEILNTELKNKYSTINGLKSVPKILGISKFEKHCVMVTVFAKCEIEEYFNIERILRLIIKYALDKENISISLHQNIVKS